MTSWTPADSYATDRSQLKTDCNEEFREASLFMCQGAADSGAGAEKSRRDLGGAEKNLFFSFDELDDKNCFKIAL